MTTQKRHPWRALFTLIFIFVLGTASLVVGKLTNKGASYTPSLALDLQGGTQLILTPVASGGVDREVTENDITEYLGVDSGYSFTGNSEPDPLVLSDEFPSGSSDASGGHSVAK